MPLPAYCCGRKHNKRRKYRPGRDRQRHPRPAIPSHAHAADRYVDRSPRQSALRVKSAPAAAHRASGKGSSPCNGAPARGPASHARWLRPPSFRASANRDRRHRQGAWKRPCRIFVRDRSRLLRALPRRLSVNSIHGMPPTTSAPSAIACSINSSAPGSRTMPSWANATICRSTMPRNSSRSLHKRFHAFETRLAVNIGKSPNVQIAVKCRQRYGAAAHFRRSTIPRIFP